MTFYYALKHHHYIVRVNIMLHALLVLAHGFNINTLFLKVPLFIILETRIKAATYDFTEYHTCTTPDRLATCEAFITA